MIRLLQNAITRLLAPGVDKEQVVLEILGEEEMFGLNIVRQSKGRLRRAGLYSILGNMEMKGLLSARNVKKTVTIRETSHGKVREREREVKQRMYRRGIPPARVL
jgi:hypothetical protein